MGPVILILDAMVHPMEIAYSVMNMLYGWIGAGVSILGQEQTALCGVGTVIQDVPHVLGQIPLIVPLAIATPNLLMEYVAV